MARTSESALTKLMKAVCVHSFGGLETLIYEEVLRPLPGEGQVLVRVKAAGVGPWDAGWKAPQAGQDRLGGSFMTAEQLSQGRQSSLDGRNR